MTSAPGVSCSSPKPRKSIPLISRELLLALIPHRHGYKAHSFLSISPLLPHRITPPGRQFSSPEFSAAAAFPRQFRLLRWALAPLSCSVCFPVSRCVSWPRHRLLACTAGAAAFNSDEPEPQHRHRRPIPAELRRASTPCLHHLLRRVLVHVWWASSLPETICSVQ